MSSEEQAAAPAAQAQAQAQEAGQPDAPGRASVAVVVRDREGNPLAGIPVSLAGPEQLRLTTDDKGMVRAEVAGGTYSVSVVKGCAAEVDITDGEVAQANLLEGQHLDGSLWAEWRHRFSPETTDHPSDWQRADGGTDNDSLPTWTPDTPYVVSYSVVDRCKGSALAPNVSVANWHPVASPNISIVDPGTSRSDGSAIVRFTAQCSGSGVLSIMMRTGREGDNVDLLAHSRRGGGRPSCGRT